MSRWLPFKGRDRGTDREGPHRDGGRDGAGAATAGGQWSPQGLEGAGRAPPWSPRRERGFWNDKKEFLSS